MVIPQVLDEKRCLFFILSRFLHVFSNVYKIIEASKIQCRIVIRQVLDENRWLFFVIPQVLDENRWLFLIIPKRLKSNVEWLFLEYQMRVDHHF